MRRAFRAGWLLPISGPPVRDGVVVVEDKRIVAVGDAKLKLRPTPERQSWAEASASVEDLGRVVLLPGLVNAHTHLELSWLRGRVPPRGSFGEWVRDLMRQRGDADAATIRGSIDKAIAEARACGTALVGDVANTTATAEALLTSELGGVVCREVIGFAGGSAAAIVSRAVAELAAVPWTERLRGTLAAHAPYSISPAAIRSVADYVRAHEGVTSVHVSESPEEVEFVRTGFGPPRALLEELQVWDPGWCVPACSPVEYLDSLGFFGARTMAVHCVQATSGDLALLRERGATVVACPRSNEWVGVGQAPIARFFESGVRVAVGTDSLASAPDLNVFAELAAARRLAPHVAARDLLRAATLNGAEALSFGATHGSIESGKTADLIAVSLPANENDVEEYLLTGIQPRDVRWIARAPCDTP